ncbi:MAG: hypothetical protein KDI52_12145 [Xanthomonadales bacterium]|nr:hypothetical protein [Xanthomonadales bacterium]
MKKINILFILVLFLFSSSLVAQTINVNGIRDFTITESTLVTVNGNSGVQFPFEIIGTGGFKARFIVDSDVNATISQGTITEIIILSDISGPVTSLSPLKIMDQSVFVTGDTVLAGIASMDDLNLGDLVTVAGSINEADNSMQLSRLELMPTLDEWSLRGFARNITATDFTIGGLALNINAVVPLNCTDGFVENTFVSIDADPDPAYISNNNGLLSTLTGIECEPPDVEIIPGNDSIPIVVEGFVSEIIDLSTIRINDFIVSFDSNTEFDNGEIEHLDVGTKVEVQGLIDTDTQLITATTIRFLHIRVKAELPLNPSDVSINQGLSLFGQDFLITPQTRDEDNILSSGIVAPIQVQVRGFVDSQGQIFLQRVRERGSADYNDVSLRGELTAVSMPQLAINNVNIDSTSSQFIIDENPVDMATFFAQLEVGMQVEISEAIYDDMSNELSAGIIELIEAEIEDDPDAAGILEKSGQHHLKEIIGTGGVGIGTIYGTEIIFATGFD